MTTILSTICLIPRWTVPIALSLAAASALAEPALPAVEHSDCIIEPMVVVEVGTSVAGVIDEMLVDRSDRVDAGQPLARLESSVEEVTVRRSEERADMLSELRAREADLKLARQKTQRISDLYTRRMVSKQQRDEAANELERADQAVKIAREKLRLARLDLEHARAQLDRRLIRSPIKGVILERLAQAGEYVDERPLLSVAQLDPLRVEVLMPAQSFGVIQPGMSAEVMPEMAAQAPLAARVVLVDPIIDTASGTFGVRLELPNGEYAIPSGMRCRVSFLGSESEQESVATESGETLDDAGFLSPARHRALGTEPPPELDPPAGDPSAVAEEPALVAQPPAAEPLPSSPPEPLPAPVSPVQPQELDLGVDLQLTEAVLETPSPACWRLGPWDAAAARDAVAERLGRLGARTESRDDTGSRTRNWMVYVDGHGGADTADRLTGLALAGIEDLYIIRRGARRGDVSVGLYTHRSNALRRVRDLGARGFAAKIAPHGRSTTRYWLQVSGIDKTSLDALDELAESIKAPMACARPGGRLMLGDRPAPQVISHAD